MRSWVSLVLPPAILLLGLSCAPPPAEERQSHAPETLPVGLFTPSADGVLIHYESRGSGGPALVLVHGWSCDMSYWKPQVDHFASHRQTVTLDLAGHGKSGLDRKAWTMAAFGQDVQAVIEALDLKQVVLVGHSMGGSVILEAARRVPERVAALVPVDTFFDVEQRFSTEQANQFLTPFRADFPSATRVFLRENMFTPGTDPALVERIVADMSAAPAEVALGALEELVTHDLTALLGQVRSPIRCINSDKYATQVEIARRYAPSFGVILMSGVGHFPMLEDPETFNRLLAETVKELVSGQATGSTAEGYRWPGGLGKEVKVADPHVS
ncbi:MAG: alpha/beta fold hydrolase [Acidobacteriota bacterium]